MLIFIKMTTTTEIKKIRRLEELDGIQSGEKIILVRNAVESCPVTYQAHGELKEPKEHYRKGILVTRKTDPDETFGGSFCTKMNIFPTEFYLYGIEGNELIGEKLLCGGISKKEENFTFSRGEYFK